MTPDKDAVPRHAAMLQYMAHELRSARPGAETSTRSLALFADALEHIAADLMVSAGDCGATGSARGRRRGAVQ